MMPDAPATSANPAGTAPLVPVDQPRQVFESLRPGDRVEVDHEVKVGLTRWHTKTTGTVVAKGRERRGLHFDRNRDDKMFNDVIILRLDDGSLSTITLDEFTVLRRLPGAEPSSEAAATSAPGASSAAGQ